MSFVDPQRYRERLVILCASLHDEGLEELTLRLAMEDYPDAHRTRRGTDGGVDVFSDYGNPPERGWQAKNYPDDTRWDKCRESLKAAMQDEDAPPQYTIVFPRRLTKNQRKFWRDEFLPEQLAFYERLETLDYWDDLAAQLEERPDLVDLLADGALSAYFRTVMAETGEKGVSPLASAPDLAEGAAGVAEFAAKVGERDPRFAYGIIGREADAGDATIPEDRVLFTIQHGARLGLPRYAVTVREGDRVTATEAKPREGADVLPPVLWFSDDADGQAERARIRASLAKGREITVAGGSAVGLDPRDVPDRFRPQTDEDGLLRSGELDIGLSEALELTVTVDILGTELAERPELIPLYRVPAEPGAKDSWAGAVGGCVIAFDIYPHEGGSEATSVGEDALELVVGIGLWFYDERPAHALAGLGFTRAIGLAKSVRFDCPGLLPEGGIEAGPFPAPSNEAQETWETGAIIAGALKLLNQRDDLDRRMPTEVTERDRAIAEQVHGLLGADGVRVRADKEFFVGLPPDTDAAAEPSSLLRTIRRLPDLCGRPTNLSVEQTIHGAEAVEVVTAEDRPPQLRCRPLAGEAQIILLAVEVSEPQEAPA